MGHDHHNKFYNQLTPEEQRVVDTINNTLSRDQVLTTLKSTLQAAISVEQATIPIYLYTYYSLNRTNKSGENIRPIDLYANKAGASVMSVAVEEMLHMSLACNVLNALGAAPKLYLNSPANYPSPLPAHNLIGPKGPRGARDGDVLIPLAKFSYDQLWHFLQIERPETEDAIPQDENWDTIGQFYAYIRCLICSNHITDEDFQKGPQEQQVQHYNYSPNNIDTISAMGKFDSWGMPSAGCPRHSNGSYSNASAAAKYADESDSHVGKHALITISNRQEALEALKTICDQGEGSNISQWDDASQKELSHYYKFLSLQAQLQPYQERIEDLNHRPKWPKPIKPTVTIGALSTVVTNFPDNPTSLGYLKIYSNRPSSRTNYQPLNDYCNGLYQYMFILTETIYKVPSQEQKRFFNQAMHMSMIWILDGLATQMGRYDLGNGQCLAPSFENINLGAKKDAFSSLLALGEVVKKYPYATDISGLMDRVEQLPDVSAYWGAEPGPGEPVPAQNPFADSPTFPQKPPSLDEIPAGLPLHACMGLNSCKASDRFGNKGHEDPNNPGQYITNDCAGQGYCSTTTDHHCHVLNDCKHQGGCGLYGTAEEMDAPGNNECKSMGSCATPINAERFSTNGKNRGKSVWLRARKVFEESGYNDIRKDLLSKGLDQPLPEKLGHVPAPFTDKGPTYQWISDDNKERGNMTSCGSSGMSGAGGCS